QSSLASLPGNRIGEQSVPWHANNHNYCIIPARELIVKLSSTNSSGSVNNGQGDREGRPYNTKLPVLHVTVYCTGDPRGRPDHLSQVSRREVVESIKEG